MVWGDYPKEFNPKIHGAYDPSRYYGPKDTKFTEVKLSQFVSWLGRRNKTPNAMVQATSRAYHRWQGKHVLPSRAGVAPIFQIVACSMALAYVINYDRIVMHANQKYHW